MTFKAVYIVFIAIFLFSSSVYAKPGHGHDKNSPLPPGLQKREGSLPPGWQKKLAVGTVLEDSIYAQASVVVPLGKDGSVTIEVDGRLLKLHEKTRKVLEILR